MARRNPDASSEVSPRHIGIAAEAFCAGQFSRCGYDILVQYGANQPEYDLAVVKKAKILKISVKGSQKDAWGLTQSFLKNADYRGAVDKWLHRHTQGTVICFVNFKDVDLSELPRMYLATPKEVAQRLKQMSKRRGGTTLYELKTWSRGNAAGTVERIPVRWRFSPERIERPLSEAGMAR
jgi:hypothetical protein